MVSGIRGGGTGGALGGPVTAASSTGVGAADSGAGRNDAARTRFEDLLDQGGAEPPSTDGPLLPFAHPHPCPLPPAGEGVQMSPHATSRKAQPVAQPEARPASQSLGALSLPLPLAGEGGGEGLRAPEPAIPPRQQHLDAPPPTAGVLSAPSATLQALARATGPLPRQWQLEITTGHQAPLTLHAERATGWTLAVQLPAAQPVSATQLDRLATRLTRGGIAVDSLRSDAHAKTTPSRSPRPERTTDDALDDDAHDDAPHRRVRR